MILNDYLEWIYQLTVYLFYFLIFLVIPLRVHHNSEIRECILSIDTHIHTHTPTHTRTHYVKMEEMTRGMQARDF